MANKTEGSQTSNPAPMSQGNQVKLGFELEGVTIPLSRILPLKPVAEQARKTPKYAAILASVREVGVIEPLMIHPLPGTDGQYLLLDGHLRIEALKELGYTEVFCLVSTDDEAYTYNHRVNRLPPIQEHFMIIRALERGISEERIARALHVDVKQIRSRRDMLRGICPEAVALLKNTPMASGPVGHLRAVKPARQVEIVEMMTMVANFTGPYCQALVAATPQDQRAKAANCSSKAVFSSGDLARVQHEVETLQRGLQTYEESYGRNFLQLVGVRGYLSRLLGNQRVARFISTRYSDLFSGFKQIVASTSFGEEGPPIPSPGTPKRAGRRSRSMPSA